MNTQEMLAAIALLHGTVVDTDYYSENYANAPTSGWKLWFHEGRPPDITRGRDVWAVSSGGWIGLLEDEGDPKYNEILWEYRAGAQNNIVAWARAKN